MKVQAKCTARAWDNETCMLFEPGQVYEIEHDGSLAALKTGQRYTKLDKDGKPVGDPTGGKYIFDFDRAAAGATAASPTVSESIQSLPLQGNGKYACKKCGESFTSLPALGNHTYSNHRAEPEEAVENDLQPIGSQ